MGFFRELSASLHVGCRFCGGLSQLSRAPAVFEYTFSYKYHQDCLKNVLNYPLRYGGCLVDIAIDIEQRMNCLKKENEERIAQAKKCAERMRA